MNVAASVAGSFHRLSERWRRRPAATFPEPPEELRAGVGGGDWRATGEALAELVVETGRLPRTARLLDLGCGLGRLAAPLARHLDPSARYVGLDVAPDYVAWSRAAIAARDRRFRFEWADVRSGAYRPEGRLDAATFRFPFADGTFDFVLATSLFTHLRPGEARNYLRESARVLAGGGRLFATFFLLDGETRARQARGEADLEFAHPTAHGATADAAVPERVAGFERDWLLNEIAAAGFVLGFEPIRGGWSGAPGAPTYQDIVVATRPVVV